MLNEIVQSEKLRERRLVDLYEKGILELGDEVPYTHREESYVSLEGKNGYKDQRFFTRGLEMKWQTIGVENIDGNKCLKLISKEPVFNFTLQGAEGCVYGIDEMHRICSVFATGAGALKGRSITIEDVNQLLDVVVDEKRRIIYQREFEVNLNENTDFLREYLFNKEFYTPESYLKGENVRKKIIETYYRYYIYSIIIGKEKEKNIIDRNISYFLASPGVYTGDGYACFGPGAVINGNAYSGSYNLFYSYGYECINNLAVRPILYLKSNVTFSSLLSGKKDKTSNIRDPFLDKNEVTRLEVKNLLKHLEEKRQEEEEIIRQIKELIK